MNEILYNLASHVSYWSILQVIAAFSIQFLVSNKNVSVESMNGMFKLGSLTVVIAIGIIFGTGLNNFKNVILSDGSWGKLAAEKHVLTYKRIKFLYLLAMSLIMVPFNQVIFFKSIPISVLALVVHTIYLALVIKVKPYKTSLNVHKYGLFFCEFTLLIFLLVVNLVNFLPKI